MAEKRRTVRGTGRRTRDRWPEGDAQCGTDNGGHHSRYHATTSIARGGETLMGGIRPTPATWRLEGDPVEHPRGQHAAA